MVCFISYHAKISGRSHVWYVVFTFEFVALCAANTLVCLHTQNEQTRSGVHAHLHSLGVRARFRMCDGSAVTSIVYFWVSFFVFSLCYSCVFVAFVLLHGVSKVSRKRRLACSEG